MDNTTSVESRCSTSQELTQDDMHLDNMSDSSGTIILDQNYPDTTTQQNKDTYIQLTMPRITWI